MSTEIVQILATLCFLLFYILYDLFSTDMYPPGLLALVIVMLFNVIVLYQQSFPHLVDHHSMLSIVHRFNLMKDVDESIIDRFRNDR